MFLEDFSYFCNKNILQTGKLLTMMNKKKVIFEHELHSHSAKIIWPLISAPEGLAKWIADEVKIGRAVAPRPQFIELMAEKRSAA